MPDTKREQVLSVRDLDITFKTTAGPVHAIRGVNIDLYKGETVALVGESGSGKSVTMKAAMGILAQNAKVNSGSIQFSYHHADGSPETVDLLQKDKKWIRRHINGKRIHFYNARKCGSTILKKIVYKVYIKSCFRICRCNNHTTACLEQKYYISF